MRTPVLHTSTTKPQGSWASIFVAALASISAVSARALPRGAAQNETVPAYRNPTLCIDERLDDLIQRMTLEEKAGQLFIKQIPMGTNGTIDIETKTDNYTSADLISQKLMSHFNLQSSGKASDIANWHNSIQELALQTRLGIPITIATDPRHSFAETAGSAVGVGSFSQWPETLGLAALRSPELVQRFAEIAREEYMAVGIRSALSPQIDVTTEPRWARSGQTYGEDANLTSSLVVGYLKGFQGETLGRHSVTTVTKHFPGGGPGQNGNDSHFETGKNNVYPGGYFDYHLEPFRAAIAAGARQMMPSYARPIGTKYEEVAMGFNKGIVTDLLRDELGFDGIVVSDWGLVTNFTARGEEMEAISWGVENLSEIEKVAKILNAGVDQLGGEIRTELVIQLVNEGAISEERIDVSVRRLLREKFVLGLFDNPFVDPDAADAIVGNDYFRRVGNETQRRAYTLLKNDDDLLPLTLDAETKFYADGFNASYLLERGLAVVDTPEEADYAFLRLSTPYEARGGGFERNYHQGRLDFNETEKARHAAITQTVPTIVDIYLDRPAVIPELAEDSAALLGNYGASVDAFLDIVFGTEGWKPEGKLPFDLPRSMEAVEANKEDVPFDTENPVFRYGHGLSYAEKC
ncbi:glycosyl hydrolase family 3 N terminal domain-containing protein [Macrophomina phaseolina]|uniref:beta-glucosidase n=1 Tax=Macrophomina phaseolina TaxID=35725 RepID=A0ABQ8GIT7_9PEZI|nr:glycosyl hydrolase family 3 N terminal domain-containing protein [Macrophomina phaseolina]